MEKQEMYIFKDGRLSGIQRVTHWTVEEIERTINRLTHFGLVAEVSDKGRAICCVCDLDLGEREMPAGELSHGFCDKHYTEALEAIDRAQ